MTLIHTNNKIITKWYSKPTASNRMLNFYSSHPKKMKVNVANSFIKKVFNLSDKSFINENIKTIKQILTQNNFPLYLINSLINKNLNIPLINTQENLEQTTQNNTTKQFKTLTYIPTLTNKIIKTIKHNNTNLLIANKIPQKAYSIYSKLKDPISIGKNENVVYNIPCNHIYDKDNPDSAICTKTYIGNTKQPLSKRLKQHQNNEKNRDRNPTESALVEHSYITRHNFDFGSTKILETEKNRNKRFTLEASYIWINSSNTVNSRSDLEKVNKIYTKLFDTIKKIKNI